MGMCSFENIFKYKVDEILGNINGVKLNIDDKMVLNNGNFQVMHIN